MELVSVRYPSGPKCTISTIYLNGIFECFTLEDIVREIIGVPVEQWKIAGSTAIPSTLYAGNKYKVIIDMSTRFQRLLPHVLDVPGFSGVRIHPGNTDADTEGCILPALMVSPDKNSVTNSRKAFDNLFAKMQAAISAGESITLEVINGE
jgi:hypothetical protein